MTFRPLSIAILGTRGIPARYGGFETFAQELSTRLVKKGHKVVVYGRRKFGALDSDAREFDGVALRRTPTVMHKYLETPLHALTSFVDLFFRRVDVVLLCNAANSPLAWIGRVRGFPVLINVDGIERNRGKWNALGKLWYRLGEFCSVLFATRVIADAEVIAQYYRETFRITPEVIAYGAKAPRIAAGETLAKFGLTVKNYLLYVSRLEPENNALVVINAYQKLKLDQPLVIVGDAPYADEYKAQLRAAAGDKVIFTGFQFGAAYQELQSNCLLYIQATEVGGTHPALIEAMAYGNCVIANDTPENREVLGSTGLFYRKNDADDLAQKIGESAGSQQLRSDFGSKAKARAEQQYTWEKITEQYEKLCLEVAKS